jgi:hypothetical protein
MRSFHVEKASVEHLVGRKQIFDGEIGAVQLFKRKVEFDDGGGPAMAAFFTLQGISHPRE